MTNDQGIDLPSVLRSVQAAIANSNTQQAIARIETVLDFLAHHDVAFTEKAPATPAERAPVFCYSFDEERYTGAFTTELCALDEAFSDPDGDHPETRVVYIGRQRHPLEFLSAAWIGDAVRHAVQTQLGDEVGEACENFNPTQEQETELGRKVLQWINDGPGFHCWGVMDMRHVTREEYEAMKAGADNAQQKLEA